MNIYDRLSIKESRDSLRIIGFDKIGFLLLAFHGVFLFTSISALSYLVYPIPILSYEFGLLLLVGLVIGLFGFGFIVTISGTTFKLYEFYFFIPILKIKSDLDQLIIQKQLLDQEIKHNQVAIECEDEPWSDIAVSIKKGNKEYHIGSSNNYERIFEKIKEVKSNQEKSSLRGRHDRRV